MQQRGTLMKAGAERRLQPRNCVKWPASVESRQGPVAAEIWNISLEGLFLRCEERPDIGDNFKVILHPSEDRSIMATCEKVWCRNVNVDGKMTYTGMGVRIVEMSGEDKRVIEKYLQDKIIY